MKLGNLKAAIRATKGNPIIETRLFADGPMLSLALQKTALLEELEALLTMQIMHEGLDQIGHVHDEHCGHAH
jgi:hypothetical protein